MSIIHEVNSAIREGNTTEGLATIIAPSPGAALTIIEMLPDIIDKLKEAVKIFSESDSVTKNRRREEIGVGPRVAAAVIGRSISIPIKDGKLLLAPCEEPVLIDFETKGNRREFYVQVTGGGEAKAAGRVPQQMRG